MDNDGIYRELENDFLSTFMGELMPGVLHNFANPLNGIMGRANRYWSWGGQLQGISVDY